MKIKLLFIAIASIFLSSQSAELPLLPPLGTQELGPFTGLEATVGYIQKESGDKYLVVETPEGTKLVKLKSNPSEVIGKPKIK